MEVKKISLKHAGVAFFLSIVASTLAVAGMMFVLLVLDEATYEPLLEDMDVFFLEPLGLLTAIISSAVGGLAALVYIWSKIGWDGLCFRALSKHHLGLTLVWMLPILGFGQLLSWVMEMWSIPPEPQVMMQAFVNSSGTPIGIAAFLFIVLGAPFLEEVLFRGFIQPALVQRWGMWPGIVMASVVFGGMHGTDAWAVLPTFVIGIGAGWLRERTGGLSAPVLLHAVNNLVAVVVMMLFY